MTKKKTERDLYCTPAEAGRILGLTSAGVKVHDKILRPIVTVSGRRMYAVAAIEAFRAKRESARAGRAR